MTDYNDIMKLDAESVSRLTRQEKREIIDKLGQYLMADVGVIPERMPNESHDRFVSRYDQQRDAAENKFRTELRRLGLSR
jgi:hypothetical protein